MPTPDLPGWLIYVLGVISGCLLVLAIGPSSDAFWEAVYIVRRWCTIVGGVVLGGGAIAGVIYLLVHFHGTTS